MSGKEDIFEQKFLLNGARWYKPERTEYEQVIEFKSYFATSSATDCRYFKCSDKCLNKIYHLIIKYPVASNGVPNLQSCSAAG